MCSSNRKSGTLFPCESRPEPAVARAPSGIPPVLNGVTTAAVLSVCEDVVMRVVDIRLGCGVLVWLVEEEGGVGVKIVFSTTMVLACLLGEEEGEGEGETGENVENVEKMREGEADPRPVEALGATRLAVPSEFLAEVLVSDVVGVVVIMVVEGGAWGLSVLVTGWVGVVCVSVADVSFGPLVVEFVCEIMGTLGDVVVLVLGALDGGPAGSLVAAASEVVAEVVTPVVEMLVG